jgi:hypothetical protein
MRGAHHTRTAIAHRLDELAPRPKGGCWTPPMVERIIKNRVYMGHAYRGERVNPDAHPALVTPAEWHAANTAPVRAAARSQQPNLLGGIVRCAACRYVLAPGRSRFGDGNRLGYKCRGVHTAGRCPEPASVDARKLETYVEGLWREQMADEVFLVGEDTSALAAAAQALQAAESELACFAADVTARDLLGEGYHPALATRSHAVQEAKRALARAGRTPDRPGAVESYDELSVPERKRILSAAIDTIIVSRGHSRVPVEQRVTILWRGEGPDDLPRRGRDNGAIRAFEPGQT